MDTFSSNTIGARLAKLSTYSDTPVSVERRADVVLEQIYIELAALAPHVKTHLVTFQSDGLPDFYDVINLVVGALEKSGFACTGDDGKGKFGAAGTSGLWSIRVIRRPNAPSLFDRPFRVLPALHARRFATFFETPTGRIVFGFLSRSFNVKFDYEGIVITEEHMKKLAEKSDEDNRFTVSYALFVLEHLFGKDGLVTRTRLSIARMDEEDGNTPAQRDLYSIHDSLFKECTRVSISGWIGRNDEYIEIKRKDIDSAYEMHRVYAAIRLRECVSPTPAFISILPQLRAAAENDACGNVRKEARAALCEYSDWCI